MNIEEQNTLPSPSSDYHMYMYILEKISKEEETRLAMNKNNPSYSTEDFLSFRDTMAEIMIEKYCTTA